MKEPKKEMRRSIAMTEKMEEAIVKMRMDERFTRMSYAEIIRMLIQAGLDSIKTDSRPA